jgi:hypothetical protein
LFHQAPQYRCFAVLSRAVDRKIRSSFNHSKNLGYFLLIVHHVMLGWMASSCDIECFLHAWLLYYKTMARIYLPHFTDVAFAFLKINFNADYIIEQGLRTFKLLFPFIPFHVALGK